MIVGVGVDIIEVSRVEDRIANTDFRDKIFSAAEIEVCESRGSSRGQHYAARFAAKEAFLKATGMGLLLGYELNEIEITVDDNGKPGLQLHGNFKAQSRKRRWKKMHVSMSHLESTACAVVIIER